MKFVAVTSCPTGIAHTYMAAEALEQAAADSGDEMHVETQGSAGSDPLDPQIIADADAVIFAADVEVRDRERFAGKPLVQSGREAGHRRCGADARRGPRRGRGRSARGGRCSGGGRRGRRAGHQGRLRRRIRHAAARVADDRRVVRDPVRRRGRPADRAELRARRLRDHRRAEGHRAVRLGQPAVVGRADVPDRWDRLRFPRADPGRLHRVRDGGPARAGARHRRRLHRRGGRGRVHRRPRSPACWPVPSCWAFARSRCPARSPASCRWW